MPLNPNIVLNQRLAQPATAMQQGQQAAIQNRLGELKIKAAENALAQGNQPKLDAQQAKMLVAMAGNAIEDYEKAPESERDSFWDQSIKPHLMQATQALGLNVPSDMFDPQTVKMFVQKTGGAKEMSAEVQSSRMLPGGLVQLTLKNGTVKTVTPSEADAMAVRAAEDRGTMLQGDRAGARVGASEAQKISSKAFATLGKVRTNIGNLDQVISLIDSGAESGVIASKLPSVKAASIRLDNMRKNLGLDVVGAVTFGALSEGELNLALDTALPTNLQPAELKQWAFDKKAAQEKVADYLDEQIRFLRGGKSVADWLDYKSSQGKASGQTPSNTKTNTNTPTVSNW